jgi:hypothetical protein
VPTTRPRHTITETPPVQDALDRLRAQLGDEPIDFPDLVVRGVRNKLEELRRDRPEAVEARRWLANRIRNREPLGDPSLADEVKRSWVEDVPA